MEKIIGSRCSGKTTLLIKHALEENIPILCKDKMTSTHIIEIAKKIIDETPEFKSGFDRQRIAITMTGIEIFLYKSNADHLSTFSDKYEPRGKDYQYVITDVYVDDAEYVLQNLMSGGTFLNWLTKTNAKFNIKGLSITTIDEPDHAFMLMDTSEEKYRVFG